MAGTDRRLDITVCERTPAGDWLFAFAATDSKTFDWMVSHVKTAIHPTQRQWMPEQRCWRITHFGMQQLWERLPDLRAPMEELARGGGHETRQQRHSRQQSTRGNVAPVEVAEAFALMFLVPSAPLPVVKAAYRALANIYHPDHGGTHEQMLRLNKAHETACAWANKTAGKAG